MRPYRDKVIGTYTKATLMTGEKDVGTQADTINAFEAPDYRSSVDEEIIMLGRIDAK